MSQNRADYIVRIPDADDGTLWAEVLDLPGCFASGGNLEELREAVEEAISMCVADDEDGGPKEAIGQEPRAAPAHVRTLRVSEMRITDPA